MEYLTKRQKEVLAYVLNGYNNKRIASALCISQNTVKFHVRTLLHLYNAGSRYQLIVKAAASCGVTISRIGEYGSPTTLSP